MNRSSLAVLHRAGRSDVPEAQVVATANQQEAAHGIGDKLELPGPWRGRLGERQQLAPGFRIPKLNRRRVPVSRGEQSAIGTEGHGLAGAWEQPVSFLDSLASA